MTTISPGYLAQSMIIPERAALFETATFAKGAHDPTSGEMCVMETAAYIAGEPWSDHPQCVSPVIATFLRNWNDSLNEPPRTELLRPLLPLVIGTRTTDADEGTRVWMATDWLLRVYTPAWMELMPSPPVPPLTSAEIAVAMQSVLDRARAVDLVRRMCAVGRDDANV